MIKKYMITGDTHGNFSRFRSLFNNDWGIQADYPPDETGIIVLGDAALNYLLNENDKHLKRILQNSGYTWYLVRGNHEERPQNVSGVIQEYDDETDGLIWVEKDYPKIKYFQDGGTYNLGPWRTLVIGGAYSVDKYYRLARAGFNAQSVTPENRNFIQTFAHWFYDEQLSTQEKENILNNVRGASFDLVLMHTCPEQWMPVDLFLPGIDQSTVDNSMEQWLNILKDQISWKIMLWGHFHADRIERPHCEMLYQSIQDLNVIWNRWYGEKTFQKNCQNLNLSPNFCQDDNPWAKSYKSFL